MRRSNLAFCTVTDRYYQHSKNYYMMLYRQRRGCVAPRLALPAPSLRGRPTSLRTVPDGTPWWLSKPLICLVLLAVGPVVSRVRSILSLLSGRQPRPAGIVSRCDQIRGSGRCGSLFPDGTDVHYRASGGGRRRVDPDLRAAVSPARPWPSP